MQVPVRGHGGITVLIGLVAFGLQILVQGYWLIAAAVINFGLGWILNKPFREAGVAAEAQHSVGGIPMQWISVLFVLGWLFLRR